jgi:hypothetical protein
LKVGFEAIIALLLGNWLLRLLTSAANHHSRWRIRMSSDEKKRRRERFLLDRFLEQEGIKPKSIDQLKPPNPDFVIDLDGRLASHKSPAIRAKENIRYELTQPQ